MDYADNIVLFAENDKDLEFMLSVTDSFAQKWGFCFNEKTSKILIVGKRLSHKKWQWGCKTLEETVSYKYLGDHKQAP